MYIKQIKNWKLEQQYCIWKIREEHKRINWDKSWCYNTMNTRLNDYWRTIEQAINIPSFWRWWDRRSFIFKQKKCYKKKQKKN